MAYSTKSWSGAASNYKDTAAYCRACLINDNDGDPSTWTQDKCHLPIKEPNGDINLAAVRNARARINQVKGVSSSAKAAAQRRLDAIAKAQGIGHAGGK